MQSIKAIIPILKILFLFAIVFLNSQNLLYADDRINRTVTSFDSAKKISNKAFVKFTKNKLKDFSCRLVEENRQEWVFGYESLHNQPQPGTAWLIIVSKKNGKVEISKGM